MQNQKEGRNGLKQKANLYIKNRAWEQLTWQETNIVSFWSFDKKIPWGE